MKALLYNAEMLEAYVAGRKSVTRRLMKPQPIDAVVELKEHSKIPGYWIPYGADRRMVNNNPGYRADDCGYKPRYHKGEVVYIPERALFWEGGAGGCSNIAYADDPAVPELLEDNNRLLIPRELANIQAGESVIGKWKWRSPRFMPAWAARHFAMIVDVRPERLQEITIQDCIAEGITPGGGSLSWTQQVLDDYRHIWDATYPQHPWSSNPWVWRIALARAKTAKETIATLPVIDDPVIGEALKDLEGAE